MDEQQLLLQEEMSKYVESTGKWYKFFGIIMIIACVSMAVMSLIFIIFGTSISGTQLEKDLDTEGVPLWLIGIIYLILVGLYIPVIIYLMRAAKEASTAVALHSNEAAVRFMKNTKSIWKYYGILCIVLYGLCLLAIPIITIVSIAVAL